MKNFKSVFQFKIVLDNTEPPIWRRFQVPGDYTFWDFHVAIQDAMGWFDCHLHDFEIGKAKTRDEKHFGIPGPDGEDLSEILPGWKYFIKDYFSLDGNPRSKYWYDFGDDWWHTITLEKILPVISDISYPSCVDGERACPPEDCGGVWGYYNMLKILKNPKRKDYKDIIEWLGGKFDPEDFNPNEIKFDNPGKRLKELLKQQRDYK